MAFSQAESVWKALLVRNSSGFQMIRFGRIGLKFQALLRKCILFGEVAWCSAKNYSDESKQKSFQSTFPTVSMVSAGGVRKKIALWSQSLRNHRRSRLLLSLLCRWQRKTVLLLPWKCAGKADSWTSPWTNWLNETKKIHFWTWTG